MKKEQIIEILETWDDYVLGGDINDDIADAILALPLDIPRELDLDKADVLVKQTDYAIEATHTDINPINWGDASAFFIEGTKWAIKEIIKRNKIKL